MGGAVLGAEAFPDVPVQMTRLGIGCLCKSWEMVRAHSLAMMSMVWAELSAASQGVWLLVPKEASSCFLADSMRELWPEDFRLPLLGLFSCICRSVLAAALHCKGNHSASIVSVWILLFIAQSFNGVKECLLGCSLSTVHLQATLVASS